ncbi:MAG: hypothetical protein OEV06_09750, partial [Anaerolineae bacterium]|nr:hypothetical protein [Anaerolineae bacterium]
IAEEVERRFQSAKDKRWARLERQFGALKEFKEAFDGEKSDAVGRNAATYDDDWLAKKTREFVEAAGLSNDAEMKALLQEGEYSPDVEGYVDMLGDITELALRRAGRRRGQPATVVQPTGGGAPQPDLRNQYDQRKSKLRPGDINGLLDLKREFRKKGLEIF